MDLRAKPRRPKGEGNLSAGSYTLISV